MDSWYSMRQEWKAAGHTGCFRDSGKVATRLAARNLRRLFVAIISCLVIIWFGVILSEPSFISVVARVVLTAVCICASVGIYLFFNSLDMMESDKSVSMRVDTSRKVFVIERGTGDMTEIPLGDIVAIQLNWCIRRLRFEEHVKIGNRSSLELNLVWVNQELGSGGNAEKNGVVVRSDSGGQASVKNHLICRETLCLMHGDLARVVKTASDMASFLETALLNNATYNDYLRELGEYAARSMVRGTYEEL